MKSVGIRGGTIGVIAGMLAVSAAAQGPSDPPPILQLTRMPGHVNPQARPYANAKAAVDVMGMTAITGVRETWFVEAHPTFASLEKLDAALMAAAPPAPANAYGEPQDEFLGPARTMVAIYQSGLGYRPGETSRTLSKARYFRISVYRMRPGGEGSLESLLNRRKQAYNSANLDRPEIVYRVVSGAASGTFLILAPLTSVQSIDEAVLRLPAYVDPLTVGEEGFDAMQNVIGRENLLFRVEPNMSYVSADFAGADAAFWRPRRPTEAPQQ